MKKEQPRPKIIRLESKENDVQRDDRVNAAESGPRDPASRGKRVRGETASRGAADARTAFERTKQVFQRPLQWVADKLPRIPDVLGRLRDTQLPRVVVVAAALVFVSAATALIVVRSFRAAPLSDPTFSIERAGSAPAPLGSNSGVGVPEPLTRPVRPDRIDSPDAYGWPVQASGKITSCFGHRTLFGGLSNHKGLDIGVDVGTPVVASRTGVVETFDVATGFFGYGTFVLLRHDDGSRTLYGHLSPSLGVDVGQRIEKGGVFALSGNTGYSTGPHLHFEVLDQDNNKLDPAQFLSNRWDHPTLFKTGDSVCWGRAVLGGAN